MLEIFQFKHNKERRFRLEARFTSKIAGKMPTLPRSYRLEAYVTYLKIMPAFRVFSNSKGAHAEHGRMISSDFPYNDV